MDFSLTQEQMQLKEMFGKFVKKYVLPDTAEYDKKENPQDCIPWPMIKEAMALGIGSASVPAEYGGNDLSNLEILTMMEELAQGDSGFAYTILSMITGAKLLTQYGTNAQKEQWLHRLTDTQAAPFIIALAISEPQSGCDNMSPDPNAGIRTTAVPKDGHYLINGSKSFITNAGIAGLYFVWARTDRTKGAPQGGLSAFLVPADTPGLTIGKIEDKMGNRLSQQGELFLDNCCVPKDNLLGAEGMGFPIILKFVENRLPAVGAIGTGIAQAAFNTAYNYAKERIQGGKPIIQHQAIAHKLSDMLLGIETARLLYQRAAANQDRDAANILDAQMSKVAGSEAAVMAANEAIQILGSYGYSKEYPAEKLLRDAKAFTICENGNEFVRSKMIERMQKIDELNN